MDNMTKHKQCVLDNNGMIIESSDDIPKSIAGYLVDITKKARNILSVKDKINSIEIFLDNSTILIKDNCSTNINMTMIIDNKEA